MFGRKRREEERIEENFRFKHRRFGSDQGDLECEEAIMKDKERFGRARKTLMNYLRTKYGEEVANRALWRVNRRRTEGYLNNTRK